MVAGRSSRFVVIQHSSVAGGDDRRGTTVSVAVGGPGGETEDAFHPILEPGLAWSDPPILAEGDVLL